MTRSRLFLCNGATVQDADPRLQSHKVISLTTGGTDPNVHLRLENVTRMFQRDLSPRLIDLLELAAFVYTADASTMRGSAWTHDHTQEAWDRNLTIAMQVRDVEFWRRPDVSRLLTQLLGFLSDDAYCFEFSEFSGEEPVQGYLEWSEEESWPFQSVDRVVMFSGGLDSLAGAAETAAAGGQLVLVSHRPVSTLDTRQRTLVKELRKTYSTPMVWVPVWVNKDKDLGREHTQRTRSFLFAALGITIAESVHAEGVRFFENGVVSLNLPIADEVLRARASRTTHPQTLVLLSKLASLVTERTFVFDNPYLFKTKTEIVSTIVQCGASDLIQHTCSCAHTGYFQSSSQWHCGTCSQCIDRRIAILAAGQAECERETDYVSDVFAGPRREGTERSIAVDYVRHAVELDRMSENEIATRFNLQLSRAVRHIAKPAVASQQIVGMHKRHGACVTQVLEQQLALHSRDRLDGKLDSSSLLAMVFSQQHQRSVWKRYGDRIIELLAAGLPVMCRTHKPADEPHLQELCDGILRSQDTDLVREFPFMRWSSSLTKPDWSAEDLLLWVELKYVRKKSDIRPITEAIAADITKYGDNNRKVVYVVYDPHHLVPNDREFARDIERHDGMRVAFVR